MKKQMVCFFMTFCMLCGLSVPAWALPVITSRADDYDSIYPIPWSWNYSDYQVCVEVNGMDYGSNVEITDCRIVGDIPAEGIAFAHLEEFNPYSRNFECYKEGYEFYGRVRNSEYIIDYANYTASKNPNHIDVFPSYFIDQDQIYSFGVNAFWDNGNISFDFEILSYPEDYIPGVSYVFYNNDLVTTTDFYFTKNDTNENFRISYALIGGKVKIGKIVALESSDPVEKVKDVFINHERVEDNEVFWINSKREIFSFKDVIFKYFGVSGVTSVEEAVKLAGWKTYNYVEAEDALWVDENEGTEARAIHVFTDKGKIYNPKHQPCNVKFSNETKCYLAIRPLGEEFGFNVTGTNGVATFERDNLKIYFHYYGDIAERCRVDIENAGRKSPYNMNYPVMNIGGKTSMMSCTEFIEILEFATGEHYRITRDFTGPIAKVGIYRDF